MPDLPLILALSAGGWCLLVWLVQLLPAVVS